MASNYPTSLDNFTNPTSNDSLNSPSHSLQHADINDAVEAIEAKLGIGASAAGSATAGYVLTAGTGGTTTWSAPSIAGLTLVKTQTIGSAVSSVNVTSAFSSTYDDYLVTITGGVASVDGGDLNLVLGAATSGYYFGRANAGFNGNVTGSGGSNTTRFTGIGRTSVQQLSLFAVIKSPNLATYSQVFGQSVGTLGGDYGFQFGGWLNTTAQYTDFTISPTSGTITGGTIYVYGYKK